MPRHVRITQNRVANANTKKNNNANKQTNTSKQTQTNTIVSMSIEEAENRFSGHMESYGFKQAKHHHVPKRPLFVFVSKFTQYILLYPFLKHVGMIIINREVVILTQCCHFQDK